MVPPSLRHLVTSACHVSPLSGHTGVYKTHWRLAARCWWPSINTDTNKAVLGCAHCKLANATSHEDQQILQTLNSDIPFDVITINVHTPGDMPSKDGDVKLLTCLDVMTGHASGAFLKAVTSTEAAITAFSQFFIVNGLPRLVIIDAGSENARELKCMCETLLIPCHVVSAENHKAVSCERFHRHLDKVEKTHVADSAFLSQWKMGVLFAIYAWNASPVDGTNIIRSFAAKGREFPFLIDIAEAPPIPCLCTSTGDATLQHVESTFPLLFQQWEPLKILNEEH